MITVTWIIAILAVISLSVGIVSTIVVKTEITPNWKKIGKVLIWILGLIIFRFLLWGVVSYYRENNDKPKKSPATVSVVGEIQPVQPREEWVFNWRLPPGQMDGGRNRHTLEVEITKNDQTSIWAVLHDKRNNEDVSVGGLRLGKTGDDLIGTWNNYLDGDGGKCYLYKEASNSWSGHYELKNGSQTDCTLKRK